jgi:hypothetical protein
MDAHKMDDPAEVFTVAGLRRRGYSKSLAKKSEFAEIALLQASI